ncbi:MAG: flagellar biosynthesis anti-sigma factor FlgM [Lachnospiraceae bacterium]|nr:flagellar biosynthesis anti-sigma factor FlgM [Lachnospiraceae bacterium]
MRIEAYNAISQVYSAKKPANVSKTNQTSFADQVQISSRGKDMQTVRQAVANSSDVRSEITEPIKASIQAGNYRVDNGDFASRLLAKFEEKYSF